MQKKIHWRLMSWMEIREVQKSDPVVIIPAGTIETQGPYTYIGLDVVYRNDWQKPSHGEPMR